MNFTAEAKDFILKMIAEDEANCFSMEVGEIDTGNALDLAVEKCKDESKIEVIDGVPVLASLKTKEALFNVLFEMEDGELQISVQAKGCVGNYAEAAKNEGCGSGQGKENGCCSSGNCCSKK